MLNSFNIYVVLLQVVCTIVIAACSYLLLNWVHLRVLLQLEARVSEVEGRVNREIKIRASDASRASRNWEKDLLAKMQTEGSTPKLTLENWRANKFKGN